jgi:uroporphyrinogen decarboxylase
MTPKQRFHATLDRKPVDRPATWLGLPVPEAVPALCRHFAASDLDDLRRKLDDDVWPVDIPFDKPPFNHLACAFDFAHSSTEGTYTERTLTSPGVFAGTSDPALVEQFPWPDPKQHLDPARIRAAFAAVPRDRAVMGVLWSAHFQDACAAFGMEDALMAMCERPAMFDAVIARIIRFYLEANAIIYDAAGDLMDAVLIGNDFGSQNCLMVSRKHLLRFVFPGTSQLIGQAKARGLRVIHHSCGAVAPVIGDLVALGADAIHPIQAKAKGMEAETLASAFAGKASFCGGLDAQFLLVQGSAEAVTARTRELIRLFPTGLVISPSHEAILQDVPPANLAAMYAAIHG